LEDIIQKLKDKKKALEATNDKLVFKTEAQEAHIAGLQGQCAYLNQHLMKYDPWPTACCGTVDVNHRPVGNPKRKV
jgi:hypothetical protein